MNVRHADYICLCMLVHNVSLVTIFFVMVFMASGACADVAFMHNIFMYRLSMINSIVWTHVSQICDSGFEYLWIVLSWICICPWWALIFWVTHMLQLADVFNSLVAVIIYPWANWFLSSSSLQLPKLNKNHQLQLYRHLRSVPLQRSVRNGLYYIDV